MPPGERAFALLGSMEEIQRWANFFAELQEHAEEWIDILEEFHDTVVKFRNADSFDRVMALHLLDMCDHVEELATTWSRDILTETRHLLQSFKSLPPESIYELTHIVITDIVITEGGMEEIWELVADLGGHTLHLRMQNTYLSWVKLELEAEDNGIQELGI